MSGVELLQAAVGGEPVLLVHLHLVHQHVPGGGAGVAEAVEEPRRTSTRSASAAERARPLTRVQWLLRQLHEAPPDRGFRGLAAHSSGRSMTAALRQPSAITRKSVRTA
jgi:hypothetical protein